MYYIITHKENCQYKKNIKAFKTNGIKIEKYIPKLETTLIRLSNPIILKSFDFIYEARKLTKYQFDNFSVY